MHAYKPPVIAFLACLFIFVGCSDTASKVSLSKEDVILAFGDSLTEGVGANKKESYPEVLENTLGVRVINGGISGETSIQGLNRLEPLLKKHNPDLVILCYGGNDILKKQPLDKLEKNLESMINLIHSYHSDIMLVGVPKPSIILDSLPLYESLAERYELVSDLEILSTLLSQRSMKSDSVHLNKEGYKSFAMALSEKIRVN